LAFVVLPLLVPIKGSFRGAWNKMTLSRNTVVVARLCLLLALRGNADMLDQKQQQLHFDVLGLPREATPLEVHLAYVNLTKNYRVDGSGGVEAQRKLIAAQEAFDILSDDSTKEEALEVVNYWDHVRQLEDDDELQHFTEFQSGGSSQLRIVFVLALPNERHKTAFSVATRLNGRVRVGQTCPSAAAGGPFFNSFRLRRFPAAVIYDPVSRSMRVAYYMDGIVADAKRLLEGQLSAGDKVARVQELDAPTYEQRCGPAQQCGWTLTLATSAALENKRNDLFIAMKPFVEACQHRHDKNIPVGCFWLRLQRASEWNSLLQKHGMSPAAESVLFAFKTEEDGTSSISVAGPEKLGASIPIGLWYQEVVSSSQAFPTAVLPTKPLAVVPSEEPTPGFQQLAMRKFNRLTASLMAKLEDLVGQSLTSFKTMDAEDKTMCAGAVLCVLMFLGFLCNQFCCGRRRVTTEAEALKLVPVITVPLRRGEGEKLGMSIGESSLGGFVINDINPGTLLDAWNAAQSMPALKIQKGDRVIAVTTHDASGAVNRKVQLGEISDTLKSPGDITLSIAAPRSENDAVFITATVQLEGLKLQEVAKLAPPVHSWGGAAKDLSALEIVEVGPALASWNQARQAEGSCSMQQLRVGDRIVSINGSLDLQKVVNAPSPLILLTRWQVASHIRAERIEVAVERTGPEDRLGLHLRELPNAAAHLQITDVSPSGAINRWNQSSHGRQVLKGDRVMTVNGQTKELQKVMAEASSKVDMQVERWTDTVQDGGNMFAGVARPAVTTGAGHFPEATKTAAAAAAAAVPVKPDTRKSLVPWRTAIMLVFGCLLFLGNDGTKRWSEQVSAVIEPLVATARSSMLSVSPDLWAHVAAFLLSLGCLLTLRFLWYEVRMLGRPSERTMVWQLFVALHASIFLGCGNFYLLAWAGVYIA